MNGVGQRMTVVLDLRIEREKERETIERWWLVVGGVGDGFGQERDEVVVRDKLKKSMWTTANRQKLTVL